MVTPAPYRLTYRHKEGVAYRWFYGQYAEADARREWGDRSHQRPQLHKLNRETGQWESVNV